MIHQEPQLAAQVRLGDVFDFAKIYFLSLIFEFLGMTQTILFPWVTLIFLLLLDIQLHFFPCSLDVCACNHSHLRVISAEAFGAGCGEGRPRARRGGRTPCVPAGQQSWTSCAARQSCSISAGHSLLTRVRSSFLCLLKDPTLSWSSPSADLRALPWFASSAERVGTVSRESP